MKYYLEDCDCDLKDKYLIKIDEENKKNYRYDWKSKQWVEDNYILKIFAGDIEVIEQSEEEVNKLIGD